MLFLIALSIIEKMWSVNTKYVFFVMFSSLSNELVRLPHAWVLWLLEMDEWIVLLNGIARREMFDVELFCN